MVNAASCLSAYRRCFQGTEPAVLVRAPGRVNLIGEHVDYNEGLVLPIAIDRAIYAVAGPAEQGCIRVFSAAQDQTIEIDPSDNPPPDAPAWDAYPRGVVAELAEAGVTPVAARVFLDSDLPIGAGLASSAALEVAVALALLAVAGATLPPRELARICRLAEHHYARVPCGIMDQFVCAMAVEDAALLLDCRDQHTEQIPWPNTETAVLIIDSECRHRLSDGAYADRVRECSRAVEHLGAQDHAIRSLRDVTPEQLAARRSSLDETMYRRARHVVTEIQRTRDAADALRRGDFQTLGRAMNESHASLRDDYEVSSPELDDLAETVRGVSGVCGARMTGAGFGGCVVAVAPRDRVPHVEVAVRNCYDTKYGVEARLLATRPCHGATATRIAPS